MQPDIIVNLWPFVQRYKHPDGEFELIFQIGVRCYAALGSDDEKIAMLEKLAAWDYHLASVYAIPETRTVHLGLGGDPHIPTLVGVVPVQSVASKEEKVALFLYVIDAVRESLPDNEITADFKNTPSEALSLLYLFTPVVVDEDGEMIAITRSREAGSKPHLAVNLWAFPDLVSRLVQSVAGRAYLAGGERAEVEAILANLTAAEYPFASRLAMPASFPATDNGGGA